MYLDSRSPLSPTSSSQSPCAGLWTAPSSIRLASQVERVGLGIGCVDGGFSLIGGSVEVLGAGIELDWLTTIGSGC